MSTPKQRTTVARRRPGSGLLRSAIQRCQGSVSAELRRPFRKRGGARGIAQRRAGHRHLRRLDRRQAHQALVRGHHRLLLLGRQGHLRHPGLAPGRARRTRHRPAGRRLLARVRSERQGRYPLPLDPHAPERLGRNSPSAETRRIPRLGADDHRPRRAGAVVDSGRGPRLPLQHPRAS